MPARPHIVHHPSVDVERSQALRTSQAPGILLGWYLRLHPPRSCWYLRLHPPRLCLPRKILMGLYAGFFVTIFRLEETSHGLRKTPLFSTLVHRFDRCPGARRLHRETLRTQCPGRGSPPRELRVDREHHEVCPESAWQLPRTPPLMAGSVHHPSTSDPAAVADDIASGIRSITQSLGRRGAVVGLSGGVDSAVTAALCVRALGKESVLAVLTPSASHRPKP